MIRKISFLSLFLTAFILSFHQITDLDVWTNLASGRWMWQHQQVLRQDVFSYPYRGAPWVNHQWLWQILTFLAFRHGGANCLIFWRVSAMLLALGILWRVCRKEIDGSRLITCAVLFVGVFAMSERILERAHLTSLLFCIAYVWIMERWTRENQNGFFGVLMLLQFLWANLHGGFILGPAICFLGWVGEIPRKGLRAILFCLGGPAALLGASLVNPFGLKLFDFVFAQWSSPVARQNIVEWARPFAPGHNLGNWETWFCAGYLGLVLCACVALSVRWEIKRFLWALLGTLLFLSARRNADVFVFLSAPFVVDNLSRALVPDFAVKPAIRFSAHALFVAVALSSCAWVASNQFWQAGKDVKRFGLGVSGISYPQEAVRFIDQNRLKPNLFHNYNCGSYLVYHLERKYPVFIDGRNLVYSDDFLRNYFLLFHKPGLFEDAVGRYGINTVLLLHGADGSNMVQGLLRDAQWKLVYLDGKASVFAKNVAEHSQLRDIRPLKAQVFVVDEPGQGYPWRKLSLAGFFFLADDYSGAEMLLEKCLQEYPHDAQSHYLMGELKMSQGREDPALRHWQEAVQYQPTLISAQCQLATILARRGRHREAKVAYQNVLFLKRL